MGHCDCHTNWDCGRRVGPLAHAVTCAGCGATCPNSWSGPTGYISDGKGNTFCGPVCEARKLLAGTGLAVREGEERGIWQE